MGDVISIEKHAEGDHAPLSYGPNASRGASAEDPIIIDDTTTPAPALGEAKTAESSPKTGGAK